MLSFLLSYDFHRSSLKIRNGKVQMEMKKTRFELNPKIRFLKIK